jgi:hypothetical protein
MPVAHSPWHRHRWPWIIIAVLGGSVCLTLAMVVIAVRHPDNLVVDNYYEAGKGINRALDRELLARRLNLRASVRLDDLTGEVAVRLEGASQPASLQLRLISPTQPDQDRLVTLNLSAGQPGRYVGALADRVEGRRFIELLGLQEGQPWRLFEEETLRPGQPLRLGDEPVQGAQTR